jgi:hypothetical protein
VSAKPRQDRRRGASFLDMLIIALLVVLGVMVAAGLLILVRGGL